MPPRAARLWEGHLRVSSALLGRPLGKRRYSTISLLRLWTNATTSRCSASGTWHFARVATAWPRNATRLADLLKEHGSAMHAEAQRMSNVVGVCVSVTVVGFVGAPWQPAFSTAQQWLEETPRLGPILSKRLPAPVLRD